MKQFLVIDNWLVLVPCIKKLRRVQLLVKLHLRAMGCHLPYGIAQCYLPPATSEHTPP